MSTAFGSSLVHIQVLADSLQVGSFTLSDGSAIAKVPGLFVLLTGDGVVVDSADAKLRNALTTSLVVTGGMYKDLEVQLTGQTAHQFKVKVAMRDGSFRDTAIKKKSLGFALANPRRNTRRSTRKDVTPVPTLPEHVSAEFTFAAATRAAEGNAAAVEAEPASVEEVEPAAEASVDEVVERPQAEAAVAPEQVAQDSEVEPAAEAPVDEVVERPQAVEAAVVPEQVAQDILSEDDVSVGGGDFDIADEVVEALVAVDADGAEEADAPLEVDLAEGVVAEPAAEEGRVVSHRSVKRRRLAGPTLDEPQVGAVAPQDASDVDEPAPPAAPLAIADGGEEEGAVEQNTAGSDSDSDPFDDIGNPEEDPEIVAFYERGEARYRAAQALQARNERLALVLARYQAQAGATTRRAQRNDHASDQSTGPDADDGSPARKRVRLEDRDEEGPVAASEAKPASTRTRNPKRKRQDEAQPLRPTKRFCPGVQPAEPQQSAEEVVVQQPVEQQPAEPQPVELRSILRNRTQVDPPAVAQNGGGGVKWNASCQLRLYTTVAAANQFLTSPGPVDMSE